MNYYNAVMKGAEKISFFWRIVLCLLFPPLAVFDKGCFSVAVVYILTIGGTGTGILFGLFFFSFLAGWIPAGLVALLICVADYKNEKTQPDDSTAATGDESVPMQLNFWDLLILGIRYLICLLFPPLAVIDKGCGAFLLVILFTLSGWVPGVVLAFLICLKSNNYYRKNPADSE